MHDPIEAFIHCESYAPGEHSYITLTGMTLSEAVRFALQPMSARVGDIVSGPLTLAHAGKVVAMLCDDGTVVS